VHAVCVCVWVCVGAWVGGWVGVEREREGFTPPLFVVSCPAFPGWTIAQHTEPPRGGRPATATRPKRVFLTKVWTDDGNVLGVPHVRRQMKRTWEVRHAPEGHPSSMCRRNGCVTSLSLMHQVIRDTTRGYESYKRVFMRMYLVRHCSWSAVSRARRVCVVIAAALTVLSTGCRPARPSLDVEDPV